MTSSIRNAARKLRLMRVPGIARRLMLARLALLWEALWPNLWPILGVAGVFAALALFDVLPLLPGWLHGLVLLVNAGALAWLLWRAVRRFRLPPPGAAERRLERDSAIAHRPLSTLVDMPSGNRDDPATIALWQIHLERALASVKALRVRLPHPGLAKRDPLALRLAVAIVVIVGVAFAGDDAEHRFARAVTPDLHGFSAAVPASLELWVTPPTYTDLPPRLLASAEAAVSEPTSSDGAIHVPVGSQLLALVNHGRGTPALHIGEQSEDLAAAGTAAWRIEVPLDTAGVQEVSVVQSGDTLAKWTFNVAPDKPPEIAFAEPPQGSRRDALHIAYHSRDDYGVVSVRAEIFGPSGVGTSGGAPLVVDLPPPIGSPRDGAASSFHDLTAHPWAGLDVSIQLVAVDGRGQEGRSDRLSVKLPERVFHHPVARAIVAQRRALALAPSEREPVASALYDIAEKGDDYNNDVTVFLALMSARSRLIYNTEDDAIDSVQTLLWDTALRVEDGNLSLAERDLREIQQRLQDALARGADDKEISELMDQLREALNRFLDALTQNLLDQLRNRNITALPPPNRDVNVIDRQGLQRMLDQLEQRARTGDREAAQQLLSQLQQLLENLQNQPMAAQQQGSQQGQEMMRALQDILRRQQELYDQTFRQRDQQGTNPQQSQSGRDAQNAVRRQLGELMRTLGERTGRIPQNLGNAERAMREAEGAIGKGDSEGALQAQSLALEELREAARNMIAQMYMDPGQGQGQGQGQGMYPMPGEAQRDPLGRLLQRDGNNGLATNGRIQIPGKDAGAAQRALRIQQELRDRLGDTGRPADELQYIERLLRRF